MKRTLLVLLAVVVTVAVAAPTASAGSSGIKASQTAACAKAAAVTKQSAPGLASAASTFESLCRTGAVSPSKAVAQDALVQQTTGIFVCQLEIPGVISAIFAFAVPEAYLPVARAVVAIVDFYVAELTCAEVAAA